MDWRYITTLVTMSVITATGAAQSTLSCVYVSSEPAALVCERFCVIFP